MSVRLPSIRGEQLIKLLEKDGWKKGGQRTHGVELRKYFPDEDRTRLTIISLHNDTLPKGTLSKILGHQQTNIGKDGLKKLIDDYGLK